MNNHWQSLPLGDVLTERQEKPSEEELATGSVRIVSKISFNDGKIQLREDGKTRTGMILIRPGDLVVSGINAAKGAIALYDADETNPIAATIHYGAYIPNKSKVDVKYLWWLLRSNTFRELLNRFVPGGIKTELKAKRLLPIPVPLPDLPEQKRIITRVESFAAKIEEAHGLRYQTGEEAAALVGAGSRRFFGQGERAKETVKLGEITTRITKGESPEWQGFSYVDSGPVFVRSENVLWGKLNITQPTRIPEAFHQKLLRSQLRVNDVLINLVGASIGRACVVPNKIGDANVNQAVAVISPIFERLDSNYLMHFLISTPTQDIIHGGKVETARPNISLGDLRELDLPLPSLAEQQHIVSYLDGVTAQVERLKQMQTETTHKLDAFLPSVLDKAFRGEL